MEMLRDPDEPLPIPNTPEQYLRGVADDGSPLRIPSAELIPPRVEIETQVPFREPAEIPRSRYHLAAEKKLLTASTNTSRECLELLRGTVELGGSAKAILAKDTEIALPDRESDRELKRKRLECLKTEPDAGGIRLQSGRHGNAGPSDG